jgi:hypothetical protein
MYTMYSNYEDASVCMLMLAADASLSLLGAVSDAKARTAKNLRALSFGASFLFGQPRLVPLRS